METMPGWLKLVLAVALICTGAAVVNGITEGLTRATHAIATIAAGR